LGKIVAEVAGFFCTAGSVGAWIKVDDNSFTCVIVKADGVVVVVGKREAGELVRLLRELPYSVL
jgi:hypothetical protein